MPDQNIMGEIGSERGERRPAPGVAIAAWSSSSPTSCISTPQPRRNVGLNRHRDVIAFILFSLSWPVVGRLSKDKIPQGFQEKYATGSRLYSIQLNQVVTFKYSSNHITSTCPSTQTPSSPVAAPTSTAGLSTPSSLSSRTSPPRLSPSTRSPPMRRSPIRTRPSGPLRRLPRTSATRSSARTLSAPRPRTWPTSSTTSTSSWRSTVLLVSTTSQKMEYGP